MNHKETAIKLLADGFIEDFIEKLEGSDKFSELLHESLSEYIEDNIPVRGVENRCDLAFQMLDRIRIISYKY